MRCLLIALLLLTHVEAATPDTMVDVTASGAVGDGTTLNTAALQKAIDTASAAGGGVLVFPPGRYLTGTIQLKDNVRLRLEPRAVLLGSLDPAAYRNVDPFTAGDGVPQGHALITAVDARQVGIEGVGEIDGQGPALKAAQSPYKVRPFLIRWIRCEDVVLKDVTLRNPGAWTNHFFQCRRVTVDRVTIRSHHPGVANNDGIDIDSCDGVQVTGCDIDSGDDAICLKATSALPCRHVSVADCKLRTRCNALKLGTESLGDFDQIHVSRCELSDVGMSGVALNSVDGAHLTNVTVDGLTMRGVAVPVSIRLGARLKTFRPGDQARPPGVLRGVTITNVRAAAARQIGVLVNGIPGHPVEALVLRNIDVALPGGGTVRDAAVRFEEKESAYPEMNMFGPSMPASGMYLRHVRGLIIEAVRFTLAKPDARPEKALIDVGE